MQIAEPSTLITDYILAVLTALLARLLLREAMREHRKSVRLWGLAFVALAIGSAVGGTYHGFSAYMDDTIRAAAWKITAYFIGIFSLGMLSGSVVGCFAGTARAALLLVSIAIFATYGVWMATHDDFQYVIYDTASAMVGVAALHLYTGCTRRDPSSPWIIAAVLVSVFAAAVQYSGIDVHRNFNHNDLYHLIQMLAMYLFYRGGTLLRDRESAAQ